MATLNKFKKGDKVKVTMRNGKTLTGAIAGRNINYCTYQIQYDVDYDKYGDGNIWTMICIPESAIQPITNA